MISIFPADAVAFDSNGLGPLEPSSCVISETLNGAFDLTLTHPIDAGGKWKRIRDQRIIRAPCPTPAVPPVLFQVVNYSSTQFSDARTSYHLDFDGSGSVVSAVAMETVPANTFLKMSSDLPVVRFADAWYQAYVYAYTNAGVSEFRYVNLTESGGSSTSSGTGILFLGNGQDNPAFARQAQTTLQLFRVYRVVTKLTEVTAYARHVFYDLQLSPDPRRVGGRWMSVSQNSGYSAIRLFTGMLRDSKWSFASDIQATGSPEIYSIPKNCVEILLDEETGLCRAFGAELCRNRYEIGFFSRVGTDRGMIIREGKNLTGLTIDVNTEKVVTRVIPYGKDANGVLTQLSGFDTSITDNAIDSPRIGLYPWPRCLSLLVDEADLSVSGKTAAQCVTAMRQAVSKLWRDKLDEPEIHVDVDFVMLRYTEEYREIQHLENAFLGDSVRVVSERLGVDTTVRVNAYTYDAVARRYQKLTMESVSDQKGLLGTFSAYILKEASQA